MLLLLLFIFSWGSASDEESDDLEVDHLQELMLACFDSANPRVIQNATFVVRGIDGYRDVRLTLDVGITSAKDSCRLEWVVADPYTGHPKGDIESFTVSERDPVHTLYDSLTGQFPTGIVINIWLETTIGGYYLQLEQFHPNNLVSGKFVRSIVWNICDAFGALFDRDLMTIIWDDYSSNRELYWLKKGTGLTYFEGEWDLEYECILDVEPPEREEMLRISREAQTFPATMALFRNEFPTFPGFQPILGIDYGNQNQRIFTFDQRFIGQMMIYRAEKEEDWSTMTIKDVLQEFIPRWEDASELYSYREMTKLAENTFMYFFQNHPNFTILASHVLFGYDENCASMRGFPQQRVNDPELTFTFTYPQPQDMDAAIGPLPPPALPMINLPHGLEIQVGMKYIDQEAAIEEHVIASFDNKLHYIFFTFSFVMLLAFMRKYTETFMCKYIESKPFDMYIEI